jgi:putative PIN family toxin of toxin-antitoxin system
MVNTAPLWVVLDTNVVFEGLTNSKSICSLIVETWRAGLINICISDALAHEYLDVFTRKLSPERWASLETDLGDLLEKAKFIEIHFSYRPSSPDPGDDFVIDCAMNADAVVIISNVKDFRRAEKYLGLRLLKPVELIALLASE